MYLGQVKNIESLQMSEHTEFIENTTGNRAIDERDSVAAKFGDDPNLGPNAFEVEEFPNQFDVLSEVKWSNDKYNIMLSLDDPADEGSDYVLEIYGKQDNEVTQPVINAVKEILSNPSVPTGARRRRRRKTKKVSKKRKSTKRRSLRA